MSTDSVSADRGMELRGQLGLLSQEDLAAILDVGVDTLAEWRRLRKGPDFVKMGKGVMYRRDDVAAWVKRKVVPVVE